MFSATKQHRSITGMPVSAVSKNKQCQAFNLYLRCCVLIKRLLYSAFYFIFWWQETSEATEGLGSGSPRNEEAFCRWLSNVAWRVLPALGMLNKLCCAYAFWPHVHNMRSDVSFSTCGVILVLKGFQMLEHFGFQIFSLYFAVCLFIHLLIDIWVTSCLELLQMKLL